MALAIDSEMAAAAGASTTGSSLTYSFTNTAGTFMVIGATVCAESANPTVSTVTYAAASVTKADNQVYNSSVDVWLGSKVTPATGANNVVVTPSGGSPVITSGVITFTGQHATPLGTPAKATGSSTTPSVNVPSTTSGNIVVAVSAAGSAFSATGSLQTLSWRANVNGSASGNNGEFSREPGNGGTVTMSETCGSDVWGIVAVEVIAAAGGGSTLLPKIMEMH